VIASSTASCAATHFLSGASDADTCGNAGLIGVIPPPESTPPPADTFVASLGNVVSLAVDDTYIYWLFEGKDQIVKIPE
jgi:hypothetical protein